MKSKDQTCCIYRLILFITLLSIPLTGGAQHGVFVSQKILLHFSNDQHNVDTSHLQQLDSFFFHLRYVDIKSLIFKSVLAQSASDDDSMIVYERIQAIRKAIVQRDIDLNDVDEQDQRLSVDTAKQYSTNDVEIEIRGFETLKVRPKPVKKSQTKFLDFKWSFKKDDNLPELTERPTRIKNLLFEPYSIIVRKESVPDLKLLLKTLETYPECRVKLTGHYWSEGGYREGLSTRALVHDLSFSRAEHVAGYLISSGIDKTRIKYLGVWNHIPLNKAPAYSERVKIKLVYANLDQPKQDI